jgi:CRP-like cAMP-binding protein
MTRDRFDLHTFLARQPLFTAIDATELMRIAASVSQYEVPRGALICRRGEPCVGFHIVVEGQVKLALRGSDNREKVIDVVSPGQSFGEALMFLEKPYIVDVEALARTKLLFVPRDAVFAAIDANPSFARRLLGGMSARLHQLIREIEGYSLQTARQRVIGYILGAMPDEDTDESRRAVFAVAKRVIASRLNLTQAHFSRILRELASNGLIEVRGREIQVLDIDRLRAALA